jgi:hypothetical protein
MVEYAKPNQSLENKPTELIKKSYSQIVPFPFLVIAFFFLNVPSMPQFFFFLRER